MKKKRLQEPKEDIKEDDKEDIKEDDVKLDDNIDPNDFYKKEGFDFCRRQVFLTFPQSKLTIEDIKDWFEGSTNAVQHYPKIKEACYAQEHHKDGNFHWHIYISFNKKIHTRNWNYFDCPDFNRTFAEHPNIKRVFNKFGLVDYITKENYKVYTTNLDLEKYKSAVLNKRKYEYFYDKIMKDEMTVKQVVDERPALFPNIKKLLDAKVLYDGLKMVEKKTGKYEEIFKEKKHHWWIYGKSDSGKSYFMKNKWVKHYPNDCFQVPYKQNFFGYSGQRILYMDEFKGQYSMEFINSLCDGDFKVDVKYGQVLIHESPLVIICSNFLPCEIWEKEGGKDKEYYEPIYNRFRIMYLKYFGPNPEDRKIFEEDWSKGGKIWGLKMNEHLLKEAKGFYVNKIIEYH